MAEDYRPCPFDARLPRTPYLVLPKMALQAMPMQWRERFAAMLDEMAEAGLETPTYHVLRAEAGYCHEVREDEEDPTSTVLSITLLHPDPWADYRHATLDDVRALSPDFDPTRPLSQREAVHG